MTQSRYQRVTSSRCLLPPLIKPASHPSSSSSSLGESNVHRRVIIPQSDAHCARESTRVLQNFPPPLLSLLTAFCVPNGTVPSRNSIPFNSESRHNFAPSSSLSSLEHDCITHFRDETFMHITRPILAKRYNARRGQ